MQSLLCAHKILVPESREDKERGLAILLLLLVQPFLKDALSCKIRGLENCTAPRLSLRHGGDVPLYCLIHGSL